MWSLYDFIKNPILINAAFLTWDIASIAVPFVPGSYITDVGKYILKSGSNTDDVVKVFKGLDKAERIKAIKDGAVVLPYKALKKLTKWTGLEAHHLIEKRFAKKLGLENADQFLGIAIDSETHQKITNSFRYWIAYDVPEWRKKDGVLYTSDVSPQNVWDAVCSVYTEHGMTEYLKPLKEYFEQIGHTDLNWNGVE